MKYYIDDDDRAFVVTEEGIYQMYTNGKIIKTSKLYPDPIHWHECNEKEAKESAKLYESYFNNGDY